MATDNRNAAAMPLTRAGAVTERLREMIRSGELPAGTHLRQADFAERFGVSTTPVREAFVALAREGLVTQDAHRGVVVFESSIDELHEVYEIRIVLEPLATEIAAKQISDDEIAALERIVMQMRTAKPARFVELNEELHGRIYAATDRKRLLEIIDKLRETAANYVGIGVIRYHPDYRKDVEMEHEEIVEALKARAPKRAAKAMRKHLEHSARHVAELIAESGTLDSAPDRP
jgi:DNA-binding GntR family transcriptional regulator